MHPFLQHRILFTLPLSKKMLFALPIIGKTLLTPVHLIQPQPCMTFTMCKTAMGWPARKIKAFTSIYKRIYRTLKRRKPQFPKMGV